MHGLSNPRAFAFAGMLFIFLKSRLYLHPNLVDLSLVAYHFFSETLLITLFRQSVVSCGSTRETLNSATVVGTQKMTKA